MNRFVAFLWLCLIGFALCGHTTEEWKSRTIYQIVTDRFAGGQGYCDLPRNNYCGGNWRALVSKLDYITGMGFDAIWISPVVQNVDGAFHGYAAKNIFELNDHFGTKDDFHYLVNECHKRGIWIMVDVVANHMAGGDYRGFYPFNRDYHYHSCGGCPSGCNIGNWNNLTEIEHCRLSGLNDLNQDQPYVRKTLKTWIHNLVNTFDIDGLRLDTVPEVKLGFWQEFMQSAGVFAVGEAFTGRMDWIKMFENQAIPGMISYPMYWTMRNVWQWNHSMKELGSQLRTYRSTFHDIDSMGTFLDNHDNPRFLHDQGDHKKYMAALAFTLYSPGIPIIYYGTEQGYSGAQDPYNREALWPNYNESSELYTFLKTLIDTRKKFQIWNHQVRELYALDDLYVFARGSLMVATTNKGSNAGDVSVTVPNVPFSNGQTVCNIFYPHSDCQVVRNHSFEVYLKNGETKVYVPQ
eukprot:TRINITY_DN5249_c0_g1_i1.p1 TRINITY_DN5249_c0_g1~~TRINITY_DN5249_c0_g1_i1.p1  ORF type:complete len:463 (+),score=102.06 TRINITY_DN5249_c0_g1_i1:184-1572(+)